MSKLNLKSEYNKISILTKMETKRILNQLSNVVLLVLLLILFANMFIFISRSNEVKIDSKIALAIEDNSFEVNTLLKNITENKLKGIVSFENNSLDRGLELLRDKEVIALIHVKKGTSELLNSGKAAVLNIYINDSSNITVRFLVKYLKNLVEVLNEGQSGAMIYWDVMHTEGLNFNEKIKELNKIAINYMGAFLIRGDVFEDSEDLDKFYGASLISYYFTTALLIISIISAVLFHLDINDDFKKGKIRRVLYSSFALRHIYSSKLIVGVIFTSILITAFKTIFMALFGVFTMGELSKFIIYIALINIVIHMIVIFFYILIENDILRDWSFILFFSILSFAAGIILPITSMGNVFKAFSRLNILAIGHKILLGHFLTIERISIIILYFFVLTALIRYSHRKRSA